MTVFPERTVLAIDLVVVGGCCLFLSVLAFHFRHMLLCAPTNEKRDDGNN